MLEASCLFSFKSILLRTSGKCQSIKRTACMLNFVYIVQSKCYLRLKMSVQGPFKQVRLEGGFETGGRISDRVFEANCSKQMGQHKKKVFHQMFLCLHGG